MEPTHAVGRGERRYLETVWELAGGEAGTPVSFHDVQECLSCDEAEANEWCEFWTRQRALDWPVRGHVALTHLGLMFLRHNGNGGCSAGDTPAEMASSPVSTAPGPVSVVIPVLNEAKTIGKLVGLVRLSPLVREVLVVDDGSVDGTAGVASHAGARILMSTLLGKGASMKDGVEATSGEIVLFLDGDLLGIRDDLVETMTKPILTGQADMVKAKFTRSAGRVTVLTARPLLCAFFPELARFDQPLGGIVAIRRSLLANLRLEDDYGVDVGLLIDAVARGARVVEVDIGLIAHESQPLEALGQMAKEVTQVILNRAWRYDRLSINQVLEMQEAERRAKATMVPTRCSGSHHPKFALFDMDGVLVDGRFVVDLAARVGAQAELSLLLDNKLLSDTERTRAIASLFAGVHLDVFEETARSVPLVEGAVETVIALREAGYQVGIVTDCYHVVADTIRRRVFADFSVAHLMSFRNCTATGEIVLSPLMAEKTGCPQHESCKSNVLRNLSAVAGLVPEKTLAVGDGENDICMLREAGISVAFRPRSALVSEAATYAINGSLLEILDIPTVSCHHRSKSGDADRMGDTGRDTVVRVAAP